jgi:AcrR family transcriptional regulator
MAPRSYNSAIRKDAEAETLRRIVAATVELHAEKGAMATTHAEIAERAGVSVPTVYKHFPTRNALLPACVGEVASKAPAIDVETILTAPDFDTRLVLLVEAVYGRYRYFHPWIRWNPTDAPFLPEIADAANEASKQLELLAKAVLKDRFAGKVPSTVLALVLVLLDYCTWQRLDQLLGKPKAVNRAAIQALQLIVSSSNESE